jgi:hypothetical protein
MHAARIMYLLRSDLNIHMQRLLHMIEVQLYIYIYCDMTPESRNKEIRIDVHC